ncbi:MAG: putative DNA-binding domain-containing protein [Nitrosomonas sp.]|nr:putative DNA-binding domain-containing protein [Nitrosomonas sp.]
MNTTYNTPDRSDFVHLQYAFAAHIRDPEHNPCPEDVEARRMKIYRELFYNNVEGFMASTYPVLRSIMPDQRWHAMIRDYYAKHQSHTPLFPEMPREFLKYLEYERKTEPDDPPFMLELAHYEWVELALSILDEKIDGNSFEIPDKSDDLLAGIPVASPLAWVLGYHFPVHRISADFQPQTPDKQITYLIVYRDVKDEIHFMEANSVTARLLQLIIDNTGHDCRNGKALLEQIAVELNHVQSDIVIEGGRVILHDFMERTILLGVRSQHQIATL